MPSAAGRGTTVLFRASSPGLSAEGAKTASAACNASEHGHGAVSCMNVCVVIPTALRVCLAPRKRRQREHHCLPQHDDKRRCTCRRPVAHDTQTNGKVTATCDAHTRRSAPRRRFVFRETPTFTPAWQWPNETVWKGLHAMFPYCLPPQGGATSTQNDHMLMRTEWGHISGMSPQPCGERARRQTSA